MARRAIDITRLLNRGVKSSLLSTTPAITIQKSFMASAAYPKTSLLPRDEVSSRVIDAARLIKSTPLNVNSSSHLVNDLNYDSFLTKAFIENVSEEFCVSIEPTIASSIATIDDAILYISTHPKAR